MAVEQGRGRLGGSATWRLRGRLDKRRERATERHRDLPGFYPSVEPRRFLESRRRQDRIALGPVIARRERRTTGTLAILKMMQIASHLSGVDKASCVPAAVQ
ncbi:hypothetical protein BDI4_20067 [Burkholderia diffusa]|nr:hypothetical protein BDI4_20067 [Burkholderia diffusa]